MSAVVVFILFVICLIIAIPVSISLGIVAVLPGAFDSSFTASASYVIRSMLGGIDSFPDRKSTRLNSSHQWISRMPSSA